MSMYEIGIVRYGKNLQIPGISSLVLINNIMACAINSETIEMIEEWLVPMYKDFVKKPGMEDISFKNFVKLFRVSDYLEKKILPDVENEKWLIESAEDDIYIAQVPEEQRRVLMKYFNIVNQAYCRGITKAYYEATFIYAENIFNTTSP